MANRSFWTAATSSGFVVNRPMNKFMGHNDAETIFNRLEEHGKTWKVYVLEPDPISFTGMIHMPRLRDGFATNFAPFSEFERDAAAGTLPDFSLIEPNLLAGHSDYHPAFRRALVAGLDVPIDPPSSVLAGEAFLARIYGTLKSARSDGGSNVFNTTLFIGWDEPGGTFDHVPPGPVSPPDSSSARGKFGFRFDRSGYRVPAIIVSPWVEEGVVFNDEYRHTSLLATLRRVWNLGRPFTRRDAEARSFEHVLTRELPRDPDSWPEPIARAVPPFQLERIEAGHVLCTLGKHLCHGLMHHEHELDATVPAPPPDPASEISPALALDVVERLARKFFPQLAGSD
jgi:phospholipase C